MYNFGIQIHFHMHNTSYLIIRLTLGISLLGHGLVRLPKLSSFSLWMQGLFEKSIFPSFIVVPFSYTLPILEFLAGLSICFGLYNKIGLILSGIILLCLLLGTCMIENWEAIPSQIIHLIIVAYLLKEYQYNTLTIDSLISK